MPAILRHSRWFVGVCALCCAAGAAASQTGLKVGDGRFHPYAEIEGRWDSAANRNLSTGAVSDDFILHFRPGIRFDSPGKMFAISLNGAADGLLYIKSMRSLSRIQGEADVDMAVNGEGVIGLNVGDHFARSDRANVPLLGQGLTAIGVLTWYNDLRVGLPVRPGGGALMLEPRYNFTIERFEAIGGYSPMSQYNYENHKVGLNGTLKFLPKTGFVLDANYIIRTYSSGTGVFTHGLNATIGMAGLLTKHVALVLKAGWGHDIATGSYYSVVGHGEVAYVLSETARVAVGYMRTWIPVGGTVGVISAGDDRPYLEARVLLGGKVTIRGYGAVDIITYRGPAVPRPMDINGIGDLGVDYELFKWFTIGGGYVFSMVSGMYTRHEAYLRLHFEY